MSDPQPFDLTGPLPVGVTALEASAGTGKTFALSALAVRYLAEASLHPSQLCVVSFTDAATAELRGRIRTRLVEAVRHCERLLVGHEHTEHLDPVLNAIASPDTDQALIAARVTHLQIALAEFDAVTISTIHGFCQRFLISAGEADDTRTISEGSAEIAEVVNDLLITVAADPVAYGFSDTADLSKSKLGSRLRAAVSKTLSMPDAVWSTGDLPTERKPLKANFLGQTRAELMVNLVRAAVAEVTDRRRQRSQSTFDDLITATRDLLRGDRAPMLIGALRERFKAVLIDEFQDTDSVQWDIFRTAFIDDSSLGPLPAVTIVGDPKQSIYRFRSAEISAYLAAVATADEQVATLDTNWRSDGDLLEGLEYLMEGFTFGDERVKFHPVLTAPDLGGTRLSGARLAEPGYAPIEIRCIEPHEDKAAPAWMSRTAIRNDLVAVVQDHLESEITIRSRIVDEQGRPITRKVQPSDIAILTRSNADAAKMALAFSAAGIPAATASSQSVLESEAAFQWRVLLDALAQPRSVGLAKSAALGWFLGYSPREVDALDDNGIVGLQDRLLELSLVLQERGLTGLVHCARQDGIQTRLLSRPSGERNLTDLDHVAEVLHSLSRGRPASPSVFLSLLAQAGSDDDDDRLAPEFLARRIDRDDQAVSILTVHKSKGLEYPILLLPFMWTKSGGGQGVPHAVREGVRLLDGTWIPELSESNLTRPLRNQNSQEVKGEARRLLYVALTRARHRCVLWWPEQGKGESALDELLQHRLGDQPSAALDLLPLVEESGGRIAVTSIPVSVRAPDPITSAGKFDGSADSELTVREVSRSFDSTWRIWSFTGITSAARGRAEAGGKMPEPHRIAEHTELLRGAGNDEVGSIDPHLITDPTYPIDPTDIGAEGCALRSAPAGTVFGTLVHEVLENVDFAADDLQTQLESQCAQRLAYRPLDISPEHLAHGLSQAIHAPLGGPLKELRLRDLTRADRLDEMDFFLPLGDLRPSQIGATLAATLAPEDPLRSWAEGLAGTGNFSSEFNFDIRGRLTGSIDLTLRVKDEQSGHHRFWVADYKSNRLPEPSDYRGQDLIDAMAHHNYPLQAILYLVALHRYLRWRVKGYDPDRHLGGAAYLFLRGMDPSHQPEAAAGVAWWTPGMRAIVAVDHLLTQHGSSRGGGRR